MLSLSIRLDLSSGLFPSAFPHHSLYAFLIRSTTISRACGIIPDSKKGSIKCYCVTDGTCMTR